MHQMKRKSTDLSCLIYKTHSNMDNPLWSKVVHECKSNRAASVYSCWKSWEHKPAEWEPFCFNLPDETYNIWQLWILAFFYKLLLSINVSVSKLMTWMLQAFNIKKETQKYTFFIQLLEETCRVHFSITNSAKLYGVACVTIFCKVVSWNLLS